MLLYALVEVRKSGADPSQLSCAETWREIRNTMRDYRHPVESGERLRQRLKSAVTDDYIRKDKTSRNYPRKKQETPAGAPKIHLATKSQVGRKKFFDRLMNAATFIERKWPEIPAFPLSDHQIRL